MTIRVLRYILIYSISIVLFECSFDNKTGIWENKQKRKTANTKLIKLSNNQEKVQTEINPALAININSEARINDNWIMSGLNYSNQIYHLNFDGKISKFSKYKLKKIKHNQIKETPLIVGENYFITIDEEGSILKFMNRGKQVLDLIPNLKCLRITKDGYPSHPLYLPKNLKPIPYKIEL